MNDKDPDMWRELIDALRACWPQISGAILAMLIAYARIIYDGERGREGEWVEGILCGLLTLALSSALTFMGLPHDVAPALGGAVGFIGVRRLRKAAIREFDKRVGGKKDDV